MNYFYSINFLAFFLQILGEKKTVKKIISICYRQAWFVTCPGKECKNNLLNMVPFPGQKQMIVNVMRTYFRGFSKISTFLKKNSKSSIIASVEDSRSPVTQL